MRVTGNDESPGEVIPSARAQPDAGGLGDRSRPIDARGLILGAPERTSPKQGRSVVTLVDAHRLGEASRTRGQQAVGDVASPRSHQIHPLQRLAGTQQNGFGNPFSIADDVHAPMHPVGEIDVEPSGRTEHRAGSRGHPSIAMRTGIERAAISLRFYQPHHDPAGGVGVDEETSDEVACHRKRIPRVEGSRQPFQDLRAIRARPARPSEYANGSPPAPIRRTADHPSPTR